MTESGESRQVGFEFTGKGGEYFRIWIVNLLLTVVTLGIYSAWAKVRRMQYFYRNTRLDGASFDYHGEPMAILKGRVIAVVLFAVYELALTYQPIIGGVIGVLIAMFMPWLLVKSLRFRLYNSSYRGLRFSFVGTTQESYRVFLLNGILTVFTLYLLAPFAHQRIKRFQHGNSRYGSTSFDFSASVGSFYRVYLTAFGLVVAALLLLALFTKLVSPAVFALLPLAFVLIVYGFVAQMQNLVWNHTRLGSHVFQSRVEAPALVWIGFTNFVATVLTLGLFIPFAAIRLARYRLEHMSVQVQGDLAEFVAGQAEAITATGEETAELFDVDIGF